MANGSMGVNASLGQLQRALSVRDEKVVELDEIDNKLIQPHLGVDGVHEHVTVSSPGSFASTLKKSKSSHIEREADEPGDYSFVPALSSIASSAVSSPNKTGDNISAQEEGGGGRDDEDDDEELPKRGLPMSREASHDCGNDVEESTERWEPNMELELWNFHPGTLKYLAQGAMCQCFTVSDPPASMRLDEDTCAVSSQGPVVIKTPIEGGPAVAENDLVIEAMVLKELAHPNIITLLGKGETDEGASFIALEYLGGGTLRTRLQKAGGGLGVKTAIKYGQQLVSALVYMHDNAVPGRILMHRDLKPDNIAFTSSGQLKLFDFGLAKLIRRTRRSLSDKYIMTGQTGSPRYMPPEVAKSEPYNEKADVWSFSIILCEMTSGRLPFAGLSMAMYMLRVCEGSERPLVQFDWPADLKDTLKSGWQRDPDLRPSCREIHAVLTNLHREFTTASTKKRSFGRH